MKESEFEKIKKEVDKDLEITQENLDTKIYEIPSLHSKYLRLYYHESLILEKMETALARLYVKKHHYYRHDYDYVIKDSQVSWYIDGDEEFSKRKYQINKQKLQVDFLERTLKKINQLSFDVKNIIEWVKFQSGA